MQDGPKSCKCLTQCMLDGPDTETSEMDYTIGMQNNAQMMEPTPNSPYADQNQWQNVLGWWLGMHSSEAHAMVGK